MRRLITLAAIALLFSSLSAFAVGWLPLSGPGGGGGSSNTLQADVGNDILADIGNPILVQ